MEKPSEIERKVKYSGRQGGQVSLDSHSTKRDHIKRTYLNPYAEINNQSCNGWWMVGTSDRKDKPRRLLPPDVPKRETVSRLAWQ